MTGCSGEQCRCADLRGESGSVQSRLTADETVHRQRRGMQGDGDPVAGEGRDHGELVAQPVEAP